MSIIKTKIVASRTSKDVLFGDWEASELAAYITAYNDLPINFSVEWSADGLSRTRIESYDSSLVPAIQELATKYADALAVEKARRDANGITNVITDLSDVVDAATTEVAAAAAVSATIAPAETPEAPAAS